MTELTLHQNLPEEPEKYKIHPTAVIHPHAQIGESVEIGPYAVIGEDVKIGSQTHVGPHAVIEFAEIGSSCQIHAHAFIGTAPQDLKYRGEKTRITIGDGTIVRECATLNRGTAQSGETEIEAIKKIYRSIFFSKKPLKLTLLQLQKEKIESPVIKEFLNFVVNSARGVCRPRLKAESS